MKKLLTFLTMLLITVSLFGQTKIYKTSMYCFGERTYSGTVKWDSWESCYLDIRISDDFISVDSDRIQYYRITSYGSPHIDRGSMRVNISAIDEEDIPVEVSLIQQGSGISLYFFYKDVAWAYFIPGYNL